MTVARVIRIVFGTVAGLMLVAARRRRPAVRPSDHCFSPLSFGALLAVALAFLLNNLLSSRERSDMLTRQAAELKRRGAAAGSLACAMPRR